MSSDRWPKLTLNKRDKWLKWVKRESVPGVNVTRGQMSIERGKTRVYELMLVKSCTSDAAYRAKLYDESSQNNRGKNHPEQESEPLRSRSRLHEEVGGGWGFVVAEQRGKVIHFSGPFCI